MIQSSRNRNSGLTLIELLVVVAILIILAQSTFPEFSDIAKSNRSATLMNELRTSLAFARSEAVKRNSPVVLCKSFNGRTCQDAGYMWQEGWIVFEDVNGNGAVDAGDGDVVLSRQASKPEEFILSFATERVVYDGLGIATQGFNGTYVLCDDRGARKAKGLVVSIVGWPRLAVDSNANGIVEDARGSDINCS